MARLLSLALVAVCHVTAPGLQAQSASTPSFGFWVGAAYAPAGLDPGCSWRHQGGALTNFGAFIVVPTGPMALEGRLGGHLSSGSNLCITAGPLPQLQPVGTRTERISALAPGNFAAVDLRIRWMPTSDDALLLAAGGGWAGASKDIPYVNASVGARMPGEGTRVGVDLEVTAYRVPWIERTIETTEEAQTETIRRRFDEWAPAVGIRVSIEIPTRSEGGR
jgi:hypothetical protein